MRRLIMKGLVDLYTNTPIGMRRTKYFKPLFPGGAYYVFLCLPRPDFLTYEEYRIGRGNFLEASVKVMKLQFPEAHNIIGIASEPVQNGPGSSEDFIYLDASEWSDELNNEAAQLQKDLGIFTDAKPKYVRESEYPE